MRRRRSDRRIRRGVCEAIVVETVDSYGVVAVVSDTNEGCDVDDDDVGRRMDIAGHREEEEEVGTKVDGR